jgi:hypothetical protein
VEEAFVVKMMEVSGWFLGSLSKVLREIVECCLILQEFSSVLLNLILLKARLEHFKVMKFFEIRTLEIFGVLI